MNFFSNHRQLTGVKTISLAHTTRLVFWPNMTVYMDLHSLPPRPDYEDPPGHHRPVTQSRTGPGDTFRNPPRMDTLWAMSTHTHTCVCVHYHIIVSVMFTQSAKVVFCQFLN